MAALCFLRSLFVSDCSFACAPFCSFPFFVFVFVLSARGRNRAQGATQIRLKVFQISLKFVPHCFWIEYPSLPVNALYKTTYVILACIHRIFKDIQIKSTMRACGRTAAETQITSMMAIMGMSFQDGLTGSAWSDRAQYTGSPFKAFESELSSRRSTRKQGPWLGMLLRAQG